VDIPLTDALMQANIPRQQIVLAYAGEPVKDSSGGTRTGTIRTFGDSGISAAVFVPLCAF